MKPHLIFAAAAVAVLPTSTTLAQAPRYAGRIPVTLALVDRSPFGTDIALVRRPDAATKNLIVVTTRAATPDRLSGAAIALTAVMERSGDVPATSALLSIPGELVGPPSERRAAETILARISSAPEVELSGVGKARTTIIYLPDAGERQRLQKIGRLRLTPHQ